MDPDTANKVASGMPIPAARIQQDVADNANNEKVAQAERQRAQAEAEAAAKEAANRARYGL